MEKAELDPAALDDFLENFYQGGGYDFRDYKRGTITRRLARRLHATGTATCREYLHFLDSHPDEYRNLADDLTIKVSSFFRSRYAFQQLAQLVLPDLLSYKAATGRRRLRFWSAACARGEEPYSLAILLAEFLGHRRQDFDVLVHATDLSRWAVDRAQAAVYSPDQLDGLPPALRDTRFDHAAGEYTVKADIRRMVDFSNFDLTSPAPPPFTRVDAIFCCNVLIYWQRHLQERVLEMLYGALATPGYLILGEVETPTDFIRQRLVCLDGRAKIYKKVALC